MRFLYLLRFFIFILSLPLNSHTHGFTKNTLVTSDNLFIPIKNLVPTNNTANTVISYDTAKNVFYPQVIASTHTVNELFFIKLSVSDLDTTNYITCSIFQELYCVSKKPAQWISALQLSHGDILLCNNHKKVIVQKKQLLISFAPAYTLTIPQSHTFLVGTHKIIAHNMALLAPAGATLGAITTIALKFTIATIIQSIANIFFKPSLPSHKAKHLHLQQQKSSPDQATNTTKNQNAIPQKKHNVRGRLHRSS